jgi:hypothetical protein
VVKKVTAEGQKAISQVSVPPVDMPPARPAQARSTTGIPHANGPQKAAVDAPGQVQQVPPAGPVPENRGTGPGYVLRQGTQGVAAPSNTWYTPVETPPGAKPIFNAGVAEAPPVQEGRQAPPADGMRVEPPQVTPETSQAWKHAGVLTDGPQQSNGLGRVQLEALPRLLSQRIAHRLGSLEGHSGVIRIQLRLDPPELGSVAVRVVLDGGELKVHFFANDTVAKEALQGAVPELKAELERIGLNLGETYVSVDQEHGRGFGSQLRQWRTGLWSFEVDPPYPEMVIDEGINYLV